MKVNICSFRQYRKILNISIIFVFLVSVLVVGLSRVQAQSSEMDVDRTRQEYERLKEEEKEEKKVREQKESEEKQKETVFLQQNSDLINAWEYCSRPDRDRDKAIELWNQYLEKNPNSPFRGEIYYLIGAMFTVRSLKGETRSLETAETWYLKALPCFDNKFSIISSLVWMNLCNFPQHMYDIQYKKKYYEWLMKLAEEGTADDYYPYNEIGIFLKMKVLDLPLQERKRRMDHHKQQIRDITMVVERANMLQRASVSDLQDLIESYPNSVLAQEASAKLVSLGAPQGEQLVEDVKLEPVSLQTTPTVIATQVEPKQHVDTPVSLTSDETPDLKTPEPVHNPSGFLQILLVVGGLVVIGGGLYVLIRKRNKQSH